MHTYLRNFELQDKNSECVLQLNGQRTSQDGARALHFIAHVFSPSSTTNVQPASTVTANHSKKEEPREVLGSIQTKPVADVMNRPNGQVPVVSNRAASNGDDHASSKFFDANKQPSINPLPERARSLNSEQIAVWEPDDEEKELVKRTWSDDFDFLYELGSAIYSYIFETNPHTKVLFPNIHRHGDKWRDSQEFRSQALRFVQTLSHAVKNLHHMEDRLAPHLYKIGERHVKFADRGFKPEYWDCFLDAMEYSLVEHINSLSDFSEHQREGATTVWRRLAFYIITHMKHGYNNLLAKQRLQPETGSMSSLDKATKK
uniref:Globin family profile domain-containing protein n=1 Tax=Ditylenchus dipsaci TaxID=166011 RepID=A0A915DFC4_9BILA